MGHMSKWQFHTGLGRFLTAAGCCRKWCPVRSGPVCQNLHKKVQNCQFLKFLEWETVVYIWTFKNLIEPLIDHSTAKYLWCYMYFWRQYFKSLFKSPSKKLQHTFLKRGGRGFKGCLNDVKNCTIGRGRLPWYSMASLRFAVGGWGPLYQISHIQSRIILTHYCFWPTAIDFDIKRIWHYNLPNVSFSRKHTKPWPKWFATQKLLSNFSSLTPDKASAKGELPPGGWPSARRSRPRSGNFKASSVPRAFPFFPPPQNCSRDFSLLRLFIADKAHSFILMSYVKYSKVQSIFWFYQTFYLLVQVWQEWQFVHSVGFNSL